MRARRAFENTVWCGICETTAFLCSFILPRLILIYFGAKYVGLTGAVNQFLRVIIIFQAGIGQVAMAALYKPLAENNVEQISVIVNTTQAFFEKITVLFIGLSIIVACFYPLLVSTEFSWFFTASIVIIMSISAFAQSFLAKSYQLLLEADQQKKYVYIVNAIKIITHTAISVILIVIGFDIRIVMICATVAYVAAPIYISFYAKKKYGLLKNAKKDNSVIKQRWDNFSLQTANFFTVNTDLIILSFFSNVYEMSVYVIYIMVISGVFHLFTPLNSGVQSVFGNMLAKKQNKTMEDSLRLYEQVTFAMASFLYGVTIVVGVPFIMLYTSGVTEANYFRPAFLYILCAAFMFSCFRLPYENVVNAAGHFRQTRNAAFVELSINVALSIFLVFKIGLVGVAIGTLAAYSFRTIYYAVYVSKNLVLRNANIIIKRICLSMICVCVIFAVSRILPLPAASNYIEWAVNSAVISVIAIAVVLCAELIFYRNDFFSLLKLVKIAVRVSDK